jgi:hypothetical protein
VALWNVSEEPVQRGGGSAEWRGLGSADSGKFLIQAEILGLSALRSVIGAAFIHTRNSHLFQSPPSRMGYRSPYFGPS